MTRVNAKKLCNENGISVGKNYNMAARNKTARTYWANPNINCLLQDWWLLLYDDLRNELHVFKIPANSIMTSEIKMRNDKHRPNHIRIEIRYDDSTFEDTKSKIKFAPWFLKTIQIGSQMHSTRLAVYPDDLPDNSPEYLEGKKKTVAVNVYERNPAARESCINHYGSTCFACGFNFGKVYGEECEGLIHVHHLKMISEADGEYKIDPITDLRPVCPNCHMVLHSKKNGYTIEEVRTMMKC